MHMFTVLELINDYDNHDEINFTYPYYPHITLKDMSIAIGNGSLYQLTA